MDYHGQPVIIHSNWFCGIFHWLFPVSSIMHQTVLLRFIRNTRLLIGCPSIHPRVWGTLVLSISSRIEKMRFCIQWRQHQVNILYFSWTIFSCFDRKPNLAQYNFFVKMAKFRIYNWRFVPEKELLIIDLQNFSKFWDSKISQGFFTILAFL